VGVWSSRPRGRFTQCWGRRSDSITVDRCGSAGRSARRRWHASRPPKLANVDPEARAELRAEAEKWAGERFDSEAALRTRVVDLMKDLGLKGKPLEKALVGGFAVRDAEAEAIIDAKGNTEPDPELRDNENVPLPADFLRS
jgi:hypothetical protein